MIDIDLHQYKDELKIKKKNGTVYLFDIIRQKHLVLQPEELVRQLLIIHLIKIGYPKEKIQVEKGLSVNGLKRRFDIITYDSNFDPFLLVECKSHKVSLDQSTFDQVANYNLAIKAPYLLITNGVQTYCSQLDFENKNIVTLEHIPKYI